MINKITAMKCETCIPAIDCDFRLTRLNEFGLLEEVYNKALCPEEARLSAGDVADCAEALLRSRINLNDKEAVKAALLQTEWVGDAIDAEQPLGRALERLFLGALLTATDASLVSVGPPLIEGDGLGLCWDVVRWRHDVAHFINRLV
jgi:hypothetical protein